jgi:hypothetical protein
VQAPLPIEPMLSASENSLGSTLQVAGGALTPSVENSGKLPLPAQPARKSAVAKESLLAVNKAYELSAAIS